MTTLGNVGRVLTKLLVLTGMVCLVLEGGWRLTHHNQSFFFPKHKHHIYDEAPHDFSEAWEQAKTKDSWIYKNLGLKDLRDSLAEKKDQFEKHHHHHGHHHHHHHGKDHHGHHHGGCSWFGKMKKMIRHWKAQVFGGPVEQDEEPSMAVATKVDGHIPGS